ncbi:uncharacterized protein LOC110708330 [Chenopodium quinoa]|uniref:uncharacterized protein LOC110708330 n=1 Tax=Chenopodium quinoa TaxID=63459 RepID=UPI000B781262|nr:uncharacterized protein LOC110708330 [Chenopodium quinoa]XP_021742129.1 uncharacterized protein LOC110708330 [Chenopodium quinoa]
MAKQTSTLFLEDWLRSSTSNSNGSKNTSGNSANSSAQVIIQAWAELRDCLQKGMFHPRHLHSLKSLVNSQASLYVADPQAKVLISILSSSNISLPNDSLPLILRLLYVWVRRSSKPSLSLMDSAVKVITNILSDQFNAEKSVSLFAEGILLAGAFCSVPSVTENTKTICLKLVCSMLEEQYQLIGSVGELIPDVLAGIGYALSSSGEVHFARLLNFLLGNWVYIEKPHDISHALVVLHLIEWVVYRFISSSALEKIRIFSSEVMENPNKDYAVFAVLMATAGALRASNRPVKQGEWLNIVTRLRISAEAKIEAIASNLIADIGSPSNIIVEDAGFGFLLRCLSLAASRSGGLNSSRGPLLLSLGLALLIEVLPLRRFYNKILEYPISNLEGLNPIYVKNHQDSILFKEAGAATGVFCNLYASANEKDKCRVEDLVWSFCHDIYLGHRQVALLLQGRSDQLLNDLEKIAESAFLMVVVFALAVTKNKLTSKFSREIQMECSVKILVSFSCMEYFRRIRLPEYMEAIRSAATSVQENKIACVSFVESLPSYADLTNPQGFCHLQNGNYVWSKDEVQTARILFYLRVIPTCISHLPSDVFQEVVAATMFLYLGHPNNKVARASHIVFSSFVTSENESSQMERSLLKEQLVFYYMKRSLEAYPGITPFDGLASGVSALVRHLPAGSPSIYYCVHSLVEKANVLCGEVKNMKDSEWWKNWQGDSEPCKKIIELLMQLISLVDIQVLPELMKQLARLIIQLPKDGQNMVLNELYAHVAESDDVTRKPTLVSWLQSLSYLCSQPTTTNEACTEVPSTNSLILQNVTARL